MNPPSDALCLRAWSRGDAQALEALVRAHEGPLVRHARALLGDPARAEDAVQEAFLRLAQAPPDFPPEVLGRPQAERALVAAWLHRVTRNLCLDAMRSETRRKRREEVVAAHEATSGGLGDVEANDTREAVERTLARLPEDQREVLVLRLFGERSYREIAQITGRKVGTIGWLVSVGMKALAHELAPIFAVVDGQGRRDERQESTGRMQEKWS